MAESLCCPHETVTTLSINYPRYKIKSFFLKKDGRALALPQGPSLREKHHSTFKQTFPFQFAYALVCLFLRAPLDHQEKKVLRYSMT